jgi:hypothetical protein
MIPELLDNLFLDLGAFHARKGRLGCHVLVR